MMSKQINIDKRGIKNIIFDWGGVITELNFQLTEKMFGLLGLKEFKRLFSIGYQDKIFIDFEVGKVSPSRFREEIRKKLQKKVADNEIDAAWSALLMDTPPERINLLKQLSRKYKLFLLSNTNYIHASFYNNKLMNEFGTNHYKLFDKVYYSHVIGYRKPDIKIFEHIMLDSGLIPAETLFVDDIDVNTSVASSLGIKTFHLSPEKDITDVFKDWL